MPRPDTAPERNGTTLFFALHNGESHILAMTTVVIPEMPCNPTLQRLLEWRLILALGGGFIIATDGRSWYFTGTRPEKDWCYQRGSRSPE
jgi:hypothetical protein